MSQGPKVSGWQVSMVLNIPKSRFMVLMQEGCLLIHKDEIQAAKYVTENQSFLAPAELDDLNSLLNKTQINAVHQGNDSNPPHAQSREDTAGTSEHPQDSSWAPENNETLQSGWE